jgi:uncharacterized protein (DUF1697 family)
MLPIRASMFPTPIRYAALLRGINVGGRNKVPMKDLASVFESSGCSCVRTYIQSGNVVFDSDRPEADLRADLEARIKERFGFAVPVVFRTIAELHAVLAANPYRDSETHFMFLADFPTPQAVAALDPNRSPGDSFVVRGRDIYLRLPNGVADSKLTNAYFDSKLSTVSTLRNERTVGALLVL